MQKLPMPVAHPIPIESEGEGRNKALVSFFKLQVILIHNQDKNRQPRRESKIVVLQNI